MTHEELQEIRTVGYWYTRAELKKLLPKMCAEIKRLQQENVALQIRVAKLAENDGP